jgi:hypothetical protein
MQPMPPPGPSGPPPTYQPPTGPQQQQQAGWGRFWLGVLAGGCGVLVLEALALVVVLLVLGSAVSSMLRGGSSGGTGGLPAVPGLPGGSSGVQLPAGLPGLAQKSEACSPQPCMAHSGITVLVGGVNRSAGTSADGKSHLVKLSVTFVATAGSHTVTPEEIALRDSTGSMTLAGVDQPSAQCGDATVTQELQAGQRAGPYTVCYSASGAASAPLTLIWIDPDDLAVVELKLP